MNRILFEPGEIADGVRPAGFHFRFRASARRRDVVHQGHGAFPVRAGLHLQHAPFWICDFYFARGRSPPSVAVFMAGEQPGPVPVRQRFGEWAVLRLCEVEVGKLLCGFVCVDESPGGVGNDDALLHRPEDGLEEIDFVRERAELHPSSLRVELVKPRGNFVEEQAHGRPRTLLFGRRRERASRDVGDICGECAPGFLRETCIALDERRHVSLVQAKQVVHH